MQGVTLTGITDAEKTKLQHRNQQSQWTIKYRSGALGQDACLNEEYDKDNCYARFHTHGYH